MAETEPTQHISGQDARSGATPRMTRYILAASLLLVVIAFTFAYILS